MRLKYKIYFSCKTYFNKYTSDFIRTRFHFVLLTLVQKKSMKCKNGCSGTCNASIKRERNDDHIPNIDGEGCYMKELPAPPETHPSIRWSACLSPNERVFYHQTLSSARRAAKFVTTGWVPLELGSIPFCFGISKPNVHTRVVALSLDHGIKSTPWLRLDWLHISLGHGYMKIINSHSSSLPFH